MDRDAIAAELDTMLHSRGVPGCAVAARRRGEPISWEFGSADASGSNPVTPSTVFHLFSGTKLYTAAAIMLLRERGAVDLDSHVQDYLPDLRLRLPVTLRQLASHSSGLPDTLRAFLSIHLAGEPAPSTTMALRRYRTSKGKAPGGKAAYRNVNYAILGEVITKVAGMPYPDFVTAELLEPLGSAATFEYTEQMRQRAAAGTIGRLNPMRWLLRLFMPGLAQFEKRRKGSLVTFHPFSLDTAAIGGLLGCAADFLPLATELLSTTDGVLSAESKREMLTLVSRGSAGIVSTEGVGIGWKRGRRDGAEFWNHEGGGAGFTSETRIYPSDELAVVILMNATQTPKLSRLAHEMCELVRTA